MTDPEASARRLALYLVASYEVFFEFSPSLGNESEDTFISLAPFENKKTAVQKTAVVFSIVFSLSTIIVAVALTLARYSDVHY